MEQVIREVGDFENALNMVDLDCNHIAETFELIAKKQAVAAEGSSVSGIGTTATGGGQRL